MVFYCFCWHKSGWIFKFDQLQLNYCFECTFNGVFSFLKVFKPILDSELYPKIDDKFIISIDTDPLSLHVWPLFLTC